MRVETYQARLLRAARDLEEFDYMISERRAEVDWSRCTEAIEVDGDDHPMSLSCFQQRDRNGGADLTEDFLAERTDTLICASCSANRDIYKRIRELKAKRELAVKRVIRNVRHIPETP